MLVRGIGRWALLAFAVNLTVGAGILGLPSKIQSLVGNYSVLVMGACGLMIALIGLCFAEIASRFDRSGGPQLYATLAFGPTAGFLVGWLLFISRLGSCGAVANVLIDYGSSLWPALAEPLPRALTIGALVLGYTWINVLGIRQTAAVNTFFTLSKLLPLVVFAVLGLIVLHWHPLPLGHLPVSENSSTAILLAAYAYFGFDATTVLAGEVRDSHRSIPFAIVVSVGFVVVLYASVQLVCVLALPQLTDSQRPVADAATVLVGSWGSAAIVISAILSSMGVFGASFTPGTRLIYAMADHGQLPAPLAAVHPRLHTPVFAIVVTAVIALALAVSGSFIYIVKITLISRISVYAFTCLLLPIFRRRRDTPPASFRLPGGDAIAILCAIVCVLLLANSSMRELLDVGIAVAVGLIQFAAVRALPVLRSRNWRMRA